MKDKIAAIISSKHGEKTPCRICCELAEEIYALFPKAGEDGLIEGETINKLWQDWSKSKSGEVYDFIKSIAKAQKALDDKVWVEILSLVGITIDEYDGDYGLNVGGNVIELPDKDDQEYFNSFFKYKVVSNDNQ